jgi:hypothetical protein
MTGRTKQSASAGPEPAHPGQVARACVDAGVDLIAGELIDSEASLPEVKRRINDALEIKSLVGIATAIAGSVIPISAEAFIRSGERPGQVRVRLRRILLGIAPPKIVSADPPYSHLAFKPSTAATAWDAAMRVFDGDAEADIS